MAKGPERMKALEEAQAPQEVKNYAGAAPGGAQRVAGAGEHRADLRADAENSP